MSRKIAGSAKVSRPRLYAPIPRERLFARLDALRSHPCVWISGSPGSGKSTLAASWLDGEGALANVAGPAVLFYNLSELVFAGAAQDEDTRWLTGDYLPDLAGFGQRFFRDLFGRLPENAVLVFDDVQLAGESLIAHLDVAVSQVPPGMSILLLSREDPPVAMARSMANGSLVCIQGRDLAFTPEESIRIAAAGGVALPEELLSLCEGWAAGLALMIAGSLRDGARLPEAGTRSRELIFAYFAKEAFRGLAAPVQRLLMRTSLLRDLTAETAAALADEPDAGSWLNELYHRQHFLTRTAGGLGIYRFHDLYREFLREFLEAHSSDDERRRLESTAAQISESAGDIENAVLLFHGLGHEEQIRRLVLAHADDWTRSGRWQTVGRWLSLIPEREGEAPWLLYWRAVCTQIPDPGAAKDMFIRAYEGLEADGDRKGRFLRAIAIVERAGEHGRLSAARSLDSGTGVLPRFAFRRRRRQPACARLVCVRVRRDVPHARTPAHRTRRRLADGHAARWPAAPDRRCDHRGRRTGDVQLRQRASGRGRGTRQGDARYSLPRGRSASDTMALVYMAWRVPPLADRYEAAKAAWEEALAIAHSTGLDLLNLLPHSMLSLTDLVEDRWETAEWRLSEMRRISIQGRPLAEATYWMTELFLRFYRGQTDRTDQAIERMLESTGRCGIVHMEVICRTDAAAVLLLLKKTERARPMIAEAKALVAGTHVHVADVQIPALEAVMAFHDGEVEAARKKLDEALVRERIIGSCGCLLWIRSGFSALFADALERGIHLELIRDLVRRFEIPPPSRSISVWPWPIRIRALGTFGIDFDGAAWRPDGKSPRRLLEFLKMVVAEGGCGVSSDRLVDLLWPDSDGDAAQINLRVTVKRLRDLLGSSDAIRLFDGKVSLNERLCWLDLQAFEELVTSILAIRQTGDFDWIDKGEQLLALYRGPMLAGEAGAWLEPARRKLLNRFVESMLSVSRGLSGAGEISESCRLLDAAISREPDARRLVEELYRLRDLTDRSSQGRGRPENAASTPNPMNAEPLT
ncbi:MAG: hypothetical protein IPK20_18950 [Betaproteobacteria bacterium]|nr:hypothetical protein [Betaproteobacteria bacterium]